jgi:hypothetical protein
MLPYSAKAEALAYLEETRMNPMLAYSAKAEALAYLEENKNPMPPYSQPRARAMRAASTRLAAPSLAIASER